MFSSQQAICQKPDGKYFIPIFDGRDSAGHWMTIIVCKQGKFRRGYCMDSLGNANLNLPILRKIKDLFKCARSSFVWKSIPCLPQTEVECGPRTIMHIDRVLEEIKKGETIEISLEKASLANIARSTYSAAAIRKSAADIMCRYEKDMWTHPIRIGSSQMDANGEGNVIHRKGRKRRKRHKPNKGSIIINLSD